MFLILTPNPALDRTMVINNLCIGQRQRAEQVVVAPGGKGLNVARATKTLGHPFRVCSPLGGYTGRYIAYLAEQEGMEGAWSWMAEGETRTCILVVDSYTHEATPLDEHGPPLTPDDWERFVETATTAASDMTLATICGSIPPGVPPMGITALIRGLEMVGCRVIVDTSKQSLRTALNAVPYGIKVNNEELSDVLERPITTTEEAVAALYELRRQEIALGVVTMGADGALAIDDTGVWWASAPPQKVVSTIGCGDSLLAGLATMLLQGHSLEAALRFGVACGSADATTVGGGLITRDAVERIASETTVVRLSSNTQVR